MNISRLPGDLLLDVAYQIDDAETLLNIAQVWRPMRTMITSGHATDLEAKMRLKEAKMIEGPGVSNLTRGRGHQEFISKILRYSLGWSDLQWTSESFWGLPTAVNTQWNDGTRPTDPCFVGESGGCIYNVFSVPGLHHSDLYITRPPSERTGREVSQFILKMDFPIRAVAIDVASKHVVLLELRFLPWQEGDALFHFYDFNGTMLRLPYSWHANWRYEVIVRQFEVVDGMLGFLRWILFLDWKNPHGQRQWPHPTADGDHWSFQFVRRDLVLISEESILPGHFMRGAHLRLVSLSRNSRITQDPQNNWIQQLPLAGLKPFERRHSVLTLLNVSSGSNMSTKDRGARLSTFLKLARSVVKAYNVCNH
ncbi:hypothetical protein L208DRAFT_1381439 [Tricholoma matsutake]|nr:hypothetical protein L208DRAFT_1381439 [Tricholoma matsutake 945]